VLLLLFVLVLVLVLETARDRSGSFSIIEEYRWELGVRYDPWGAGWLSGRFEHEHEHEHE
jgi:hypothetical protein